MVSKSLDLHGNETLAMLNIFMFYNLVQFYPVNLQHPSSKHVLSIIVENSVDPDHPQEPANLDLQFFFK